jgi:hypothetical protein
MELASVTLIALPREMRDEIRLRLCPQSRLLLQETCQMLNTEDAIYKLPELFKRALPTDLLDDGRQYLFEWMRAFDSPLVTTLRQLDPTMIQIVDNSARYTSGFLGMVVWFGTVRDKSQLTVQLSDMPHHQFYHITISASSNQSEKWRYKSANLGSNISTELLYNSLADLLSARKQQIETVLLRVNKL